MNQIIMNQIKRAVITSISLFVLVACSWGMLEIVPFFISSWNYRDSPAEYRIVEAAVAKWEWKVEDSASGAITLNDCGRVTRYKFSPDNSNVAYDGSAESDQVVEVPGVALKAISVRYLIDDPSMNRPETESVEYGTILIMVSSTAIFLLFLLSLSMIGLIGWVWLFSVTPTFMVNGALKCLQDVRQFDASANKSISMAWEGIYHVQPLVMATPTRGREIRELACPSCEELLSFTVSSRSSALNAMIVFGRWSPISNAIENPVESSTLRRKQR